ncbi:MAG: Ppx/GppA family phosphatase [Betaproteobacteria bacterium]|nr:Ppx/GppA family phosphatase [Betaproteobacteria bacterium]MBK7079852.1 Ppx/GppA family phosphatase [Betaproteobacteria bacterium]MBK7592849.1 Ppx/GppA family phosphatase [Betaproteobacteria bacterium]MBL0291220.1 Ppx/GppA family phosphatase [Betaproteobacteria bacterium]
MPPTPLAATTLAVVDMGSNSFRLEVGRVEGDQVFRLDTWRETLRLGAGIDDRGNLRPEARAAALACLARFAERLRGLHPSGVRAVATNTLRVAKNAASFLPQAERTLGFPIDVITGYEEARLIYLGVAHVLPSSTEPRLVIDIGGGSTEFIVGRGMEALRMDSLKMGCVGMTQRFFGDGRLTAAAFAAADTVARAEVEAIARDFDRSHWTSAYASSGTALALAEILEQNGMSPAGITRGGLDRLRRRMISAGHVRHLSMPALKPERAPVLAGGLAVMAAAMEELEADRINPVGGALRLGVLYDLLGRRIQRDVRTATVDQFQTRWRVDRAHAGRVAAMAQAIFAAAVDDPEPAATQRLAWAALLHETGFSVSHTGFHKHGAYVLQNADMPGFAAGEQSEVATLVLGCRGSLAKMATALGDPVFRAQLLALRLAVLFHHARRPIDPPRFRIERGKRVGFQVPARWLKAHPLTAHLLAKEQAEWRALGFAWA